MKLNSTQRLTTVIAITLVLAAAILLAPDNPKPTTVKVVAPATTAATILGNMIPTAHCATTPCD